MRFSPILASRENGSQILSFFNIGNPYGRCVRWHELNVVGDDNSELQKKSSKRDGSIWPGLKSSILPDRSMATGTPSKDFVRMMLNTRPVSYSQSSLVLRGPQRNFPFPSRWRFSAADCLF